MKKILCIIFISMIVFCGCEFAIDKKSAVVFFSPSLISKANFSPDELETVFKKGELIHFGIYSKEPFEANEGRIQIIKKNENTPGTMGFSLAQTKDIVLKPTEHEYTGTFTMYEKGYYLFRVFKKTQPNKPIAEQTFWIKE